MGLADTQILRAQASVANFANTAVQDLTKGGSSKVLGENMVKVGVSKPTNVQVAAHHIVPKGSSDPYVIEAQTKLATLGVSIDEAVNGVFLPCNSSCAVDGVVTHSKIHTNVYFKYIADTIRNETTLVGLRSALNNIRTQILNGTVPR
jgi:hypothetical protein